MEYRKMIALGAMALALVACGDDDDKKDKPTPDKDKPAKVEDYSKVPENLVATIKEKSMFAFDADFATQVDGKEKKFAKGEKTAFKLDLMPDHKTMLMGKSEGKPVVYAGAGGNFGGAIFKAVLDDKNAPVSFKMVDRSYGLRSTPQDIGPMHEKGVVANYKGKAFGYAADKQHAIGDFTYKIDFGKKTAEGKVTGIKSLMSKDGKLKGFDGLTLAGSIGPEGDKVMMPHSFGKATPIYANRGGQGKAEPPKMDKGEAADKKPIKSDDKGFDYKLSFFGPQANEIAGAIMIDDTSDVSLAAVRQGEAAK